MRDYLLWLAKILTLLVIFFVLVPIFFAFCIGLTAAVAKSPVGVSDSKHAVAVVELTGEIMSAKEVVAGLNPLHPSANVLYMMQ